jgi:exopolysaccharide biosynthesis protein
MRVRNQLFTLFLFFIPTAAFAEWEPVASGVDYQHFREGAMDIHVARVDLSNADLRVISTRESQMGTRVSDFAKKTKAIVAINADYFDKSFRPIGLAIGPCGPWTDSKDTEREGVVALGNGRAAVRTQRAVMDPPEEWIESAVSGWPMLINECRALTSAELPGSKGFTHSPHARTAVGLSRDGRTLFLVVADGRRADVPGLTLSQLAAWMSEELEACSAINLDGGGSSAMWLDGKIVNKPSDGVERRVGNHLAVVRAEDVIACDREEERARLANSAAAAARSNSSSR